jgi:hypothetical protein
VNGVDRRNEKYRVSGSIALDKSFERWFRMSRIDRFTAALRRSALGTRRPVAD